MTTAPFLSRPLGNFLLIAQLSEDALGIVFRAIYAPDERRFVRLRVLQSPEISPEAILSAVENYAQGAELVHRAIVPKAEVGLADNVPYFAWDEVAGWTLDQLLERVRTLGVRIPPEYALLVTERVASALEFAYRGVPGKRIVHGLVWPGFVSISSNAEIRLGGFGLAEALLNSIHRPRIGREVAPYAAPEARESGEVGPDADVYSLGVLLTELLTGCHPRRHNPGAALTDREVVPEDLRTLLTRALAPSGERFASVVEMHRAVQELLTASPYALYTGNLALFLYRLLNPEGQNVVDAEDGDATNPVETGADIATPDSSWKAAETGELDAHPPPSASALPVLMGPLEQKRGEPRFQVALAPVPALPAVPTPPKTVWLRRISLTVAASLLAAGVVLPRHGGSSAPRNSATIAPTAAPTRAVAAAKFSSSFAQSSTRQNRSGDGASPMRDGSVASGRAFAPATAGRAAGRTPGADRGAARERLAAAALVRRFAESLRLRAALSRVEAERLDAGLIARDLYAEAQSTEKEGDRLLRKGDYEDAQPVLMRATELYRMAEDISREERVRLVRFSSPQ